MDNSQAPASILDTLRTVEFRLGLKGYNVDEVDEYLDKAAQEAEALQEHVRQLNERLRQASERIAQLEHEKRAAPAAAEATRRAAAAAADAGPCPTRRCSARSCWPRSSSTRPSGRARRRRPALIAQAEETARAAIAAAEATAAQLQAESQQKLREEVTRLEATRTELGRRRREHGPAPRVGAQPSARSALSEILKWVDENVQPANSLMGVQAQGPPPARQPGGDGRGRDSGRPPSAESDDGPADA